MKAIEFNTRELAASRITPADVTTLTEIAQHVLKLDVDGACGPKTRAALESHRREVAARAAELRELSQPWTLAELSIDASGWLVGEGVIKIPSRKSWHGGKLRGGKPSAVVYHYTATDHGTADNMANRRANESRTHGGPGSWHVSIEGDGTLIQQIPFLLVAFHAGAPTAKPIPGLGGANLYATGIELVGHGDAFPEPQVRGACRVSRALARAYAIPRAYAMVEHGALDPTRRRDPGEVWMREHADRVLDFAYT